MSIPKAATHFSVCYDEVTFWVRKATEYSRERCAWRYYWHYWSGAAWLEDRTISCRSFKLISEFNPEGN